MLKKASPTDIANAARRIPLLYIALIFITLGSMVLLACGVESGDRRPARRDDDKTGEFHRSPVAAFEQFRVDVEKTDAGCTADPADITVGEGSRVNFAVQLTGGEVTTTATGSTELQGERESVSYKIDGLTISSSGGGVWHRRYGGRFGAGNGHATQLLLQRREYGRVRHTLRRG